MVPNGMRKWVKKKTQRSFGDLPHRSFFIRDSETLKVFDRKVTVAVVCVRGLYGQAVEETITMSTGGSKD